MTVHSIPSYLPEGAEYDVFVDLVHPPTGDQTGCYAKAGTSSWVCIDGWGAVPSYPVLVQPTDFVDALFPVRWHMPFGNEVGSSLQWDCMTLRENSPQADTVAGYGTMAGGAAAAAGFLSNAAAIFAAASSTVSFVGGVAAPAGMILAPAVAAVGGGVVVAVGIVAAAVVAGVVARKAYEAGLSLGMGTQCPGCGAGYDPKEWTCTANAGTDLCTCSPVADGAADPGDSGGHGDHTDGGGEHGGHDLTIESSPWSAVDVADSSGCDQWSTNAGVDNEACESCSWYQEPEDIEPINGGQTVTYGCDVCVRGDSPSLGDVRCWSVTVETP